MRITEIKKYKGQYYHIYIDGQYYKTFSDRIINEYHLHENEDYPEETLEEAAYQSLFLKARERAYYLLTYRDHSSKELLDKLRRNYPEEIAQDVLAQMKELGLLNDEAYAQKLAQYYLSTKLWGARRALFEMQKRGIPKEMAKEAIREMEEDPLSQIEELLERKYGRKLEEKNGKQKVFAALVRMGYSYDDCNSALRFWEEENQRRDYDETD